MSLKDKLHVLVVDDMATSRGLIINALEELGIANVDYSDNGNAAFKKLAARPVHLVISDYNMPGANGLQLLASLRKYKSTQKIGFILITGTADPQVIAQGNQLGMNNYLKKPFTTEAMKSCIERVVGAL